MRIPKPTEADRQRFHQFVREVSGAETKPMFGNLGAFVNGNMFMGLFGGDIGVKLDETDRSELSAIAGAGPFGPSDRPMGGYVTLPGEWTARGAKAWIVKAHAAAAALPAKASKRKPSKP